MNGEVLTLDLAETADREEFRQAVLDGLSRSPRAIPAKFLYDARGSALFDDICELPEYYLTRTETAILRDPYTSKPFVRFYATRRIGGQVLDSDAIKLIKISA